MHKVRTKMRPHEEIEVSDQEYTDLQRQGLLEEKDQPTEKSTSSNRSASASGDK